MTITEVIYTERQIDFHDLEKTPPNGEGFLGSE